MKKQTITLFALIIIVLLSCKRDDYIVAFDPNGGSGTVVTQNFTDKIAQPLIDNPFTFNGFAFDCWNTIQDGSGKKFRDRETIKVFENMTLYAQWLPFAGTYFIIFNANGGVGSMAKQFFTNYETKKLTANTFFLTDHTFACWNTKADNSGDRYSDKATIKPTNNMELYAQWTKKPEPCPNFPTVTDIDGNKYNTVQIGSQCWMRENMKTTKYHTGEDIPIVIHNSDWEYRNTPAMCYYNNDEANADIYGALYNSYVAATEKICPKGWRVPTFDDWDTLIDYLGGKDIAGFKMKTFDGWSDYAGINFNGSNESGFSAQPAGRRYYGFQNLGHGTFYWTAPIDTYWSYINIVSIWEQISTQEPMNRTEGLSIRCIKD